MAKTLVFGCSECRRVKYSYYNLRDIPLLFCSHYYRVYFVLFCFCLLFFSFIFKFSFNIPFWLMFWLKWSCHVELCLDPSTDSVTVYSLHMWTKVHEQKSVWNKFASRPLLPFVLRFKIFPTFLWHFTVFHILFTDSEVIFNVYFSSANCITRTLWVALKWKNLLLYGVNSSL